MSQGAHSHHQFPPPAHSAQPLVQVPYPPPLFLPPPPSSTLPLFPVIPVSPPPPIAPPLPPNPTTSDTRPSVFYVYFIQVSQLLQLTRQAPGWPLQLHLSNVHLNLPRSFVVLIVYAGQILLKILRKSAKPLSRW